MNIKKKEYIEFLLLIIFVLAFDYIYYIPELSKIILTSLWIISLFLAIKLKTKLLFNFMIFFTLILDTRPRTLYDTTNFFSFGTEYVFGISLSTLLYLTAFLYLLSYLFNIKKIKVKINVYNNIFLIIFIIAMIKGIPNLLKGDFYFNQYLTDFIKGLALILTFYLGNVMISKLGYRYILDRIYKFTLVKYVSGILLLLLGRYEFISGGILMFSNPALTNTILLGISFYLFIKKKYLFGLLNLIIYCFYSLLYFQRSTLVMLILVLIAFLVIFFLGSIYRRNFRNDLFRFRFIKIFLFLIVLGMIAVIAISSISNNMIWKQVNREISNINIIDDVKAVRTVEFLNIYNKNKKSISSFFVGQGFGGFFEESPYKFRDWQRNRFAFTNLELMNGVFFAPHNFINLIFLKFGIFGYILWGFLGFKSSLVLIKRFSNIPLKYFSIIVPILVWVQWFFFMDLRIIFISGFYYAIIYDISKKYDEIYWRD